ncbi:MAG: hypothetical protein VKJ04_00685 [Vampirovibrionales bacterium]|nr:hypothetical protein [Vampirovibrionales bacterium]
MAYGMGPTPPEGTRRDGAISMENIRMPWLSAELIRHTLLEDDDRKITEFEKISMLALPQPFVKLPLRLSLMFHRQAFLFSFLYKNLLFMLALWIGVETAYNWAGYTISMQSP